MGVTERLDSFQRRHQWAGAPLAVIYKFHDDQGVYLAALIAFYGFLSLFPLLLLFTSILGFVLQNDPDLQARILDSTLSQFPVIGQQLDDPQGVRGSGIALVVSVLVAVYGALGVAHAIQNAMNVTWAVPAVAAPTRSVCGSQPRADRHRWLGDDHHHGPVGSGQQRHRVRRRPRLGERRTHHCRRDRRQHRGVRRRLLDLRADGPVGAQPAARRSSRPPSSGRRCNSAEPPTSVAS